MSADNWWRCPRSPGQMETRGESTWPCLSPSRRHPPRRTGRGNEDVSERIRDQARSADRSNVLDNEGYPKLGQKLAKRKLTGTQTPRTECSEEMDVGRIGTENAETTEDLDRTFRKFSKKQRRADLIWFDFKKVLERQRSLSESQTACSPKPRIKLNFNLSIRNPLDSSRVIQCRKGKQREVPRAKRISKLKRVIFRERECKKQTNIWKRELFDMEKIKAMTKDISEIDFNRLKISGDTKPEVTFVRNMSTMNLFDNKYRKPPSDNISDNVSETDTNVLSRLENLLIRRDSDEVLSENDVAAEKNNEFLDSNIVTKTLCLKICDETGETVEEFEEPITNEATNIPVKLETLPTSPRHSRNFREYCTNDLTRGLNKSAENFLAEIYRLQRRMYERDEVKGRCRRRFYAGFKEVSKHVGSKKIKFVFIAPDLEGISGYPGGLDEVVSKLIAECKIREVVFGFALNKRKLGYYTHKKGSVSCVGVTNYAGLEENFDELLTELMLAKNSYVRNVTLEESEKISDPRNDDWDDKLLSDRINLLFKALTITTSS